MLVGTACVDQEPSTHGRAAKQHPESHLVTRRQGDIDFEAVVVNGHRHLDDRALTLAPLASRSGWGAPPILANRQPVADGVWVHK